MKIEHLVKRYPTRGGYHSVFEDANLDIDPSLSVGLIGRNGAGKSTFIRMLTGRERPTSGTIALQGSVSWPVGFVGGLHGMLTGAQNLRFVARTQGYSGAALEELEERVRRESDLGRYFDEPVVNYSSGMRSRLAFFLSLNFPFDNYVFDEVTAVGDAAFRNRCKSRLEEFKAQGRRLIVATHNIPELEALADVVVLVHNAQLRRFETVREAVAVYSRISQEANNA